MARSRQLWPVVLADFLLRRPPRAVAGIIGGNGAGKTTLFKMLLGQEAADGGSISLGNTVVPMWVEQERGLDSDKCAVTP